MRFIRGRRAWMIGGFLGYVLLMLAISASRGAFAAQGAAQIGPTAVFSKPTYSSPIAMSQDNTLVWVANPDDDSVSVISTATNTVIRKITVGDEPQSIALDPNNQFAYVANAADNSVTVIQITNPSPASFQAAVEKELTTGAEPWNIVISPDGKRVFVANSGQDTLSVIRTDAPAARTVIANVNLRNSLCNGATPVEQARHFQPRGLAVTVPDVSGNAKLFVTRFLSFTGSGGVQGSDNGKTGVVCRLDINTNATTAAGFTPVKAITLAAGDTGFTIDANGDGTPDPTAAYPNQLQSIVIHNGDAYLPNIAASPSRPLRFNVDTHAFVNRIDDAGGADTDAGAINLHLGAREPETGKTRLFFANPWAIAFAGTNAYVASAGSDLLVKLNVNAGTGALEFTVDANTTEYIDLNDPDDPTTQGEKAGKNPLGLVINDAGSTAYVMNYVSRNLSVVNLASETVQTVIKLTDLPPAGTLDEVIHVGLEMFFSSRGTFVRPAGTDPNISTQDRLSSEGWQNCASCHFAGLTDGVVWQFGSGPRKSVPMNGTWNPHNADDQRVLNYSAIFDEVQDFEANIRNVSGPGNLPAPVNGSLLDPNHGLIISDTGNINFAPAVVNNLPRANAGRPQHTVQLPGAGRSPIPALDALKEWVRFGIRTPNGLLTEQELTLGGNNPPGGNGGLNPADVNAGRALFFRAGCQTCHGGGKWTNSTKDFESPPAAAEIARENDLTPAPGPGQPNPPPNPNQGTFLHRFLRDVGSYELNVPGSANQVGNGHPQIGAVEKDTANLDALGKDFDGDGKGAGFNIPSLLGIHAVQPYYHNGACESLACVLANATHRTANGTRPDVLQSPTDQARLIRFLETIDDQTAPPTDLYINRHDIFFDPPTVIAGTPGTDQRVGVNISLFGPKEPNLTSPMKVTFYDGVPGAPGTTVIGEADLNFDAFNQNFGQATVSVPWNVPANPGFRRIFVTVDSANIFAEANENNNTADRRVRVRPVPPDRTLPEVTEVLINDGAAVTDSSNVTVKFKATDPANNLDSFCIVRYSYDSVRRRWVEEECDFRKLPAPAGDGSFSVPAQLRPREGVAYVFVWVKDAAGNISRRPGFDFISFVPGPNVDINLRRNEVRVFRITLGAGQTVTFTVTPSIGDVDIVAFKDLNNPTRCTVPVNNGTLPESVTLGAGDCAGATTFQVEVRAVVNSRFRIAVQQQALSGLLSPAPSAIGPQKEVPDEPTVTGPPALTAAIDEPKQLFLPLILR